jgi:hypothetical protein
LLVAQHVNICREIEKIGKCEYEIEGTGGKKGRMDDEKTRGR